MTRPVRYAAAAVVVTAAAALGGGALVARRGDAPGDPGRSPSASPSPTGLPDELPLPEPSPFSVVLDAAGDLRPLDGTRVAASAVVVLEPVDANAAWIGPAPDRRVLVLLVGDELPRFTVRAGDTLTFEAVVRRASPGFAAAIGVRGAAAAELERQGGYLEITTAYTVGR